MAVLLIKGLCKEWRVSAGGVRSSVCVFLQGRVYLEPREIHTPTFKQGDLCASSLRNFSRLHSVSD